MVAVLEALPVGAELLEAVLVDVRKPVPSQLLISLHTARGDGAKNLHRRSTSRDLPPLPQAFHLSLPPRLVLAEHVVLIVVLAPCTDEIRS